MFGIVPHRTVCLFQKVFDRRDSVKLIADKSGFLNYLLNQSIIFILINHIQRYRTVSSKMHSATAKCVTGAIHTFIFTLHGIEMRGTSK
jgi:hypothetical protein